MYVDPSVYDNSSDVLPTIPCYAPCTLIMPPFQLPTATTITFSLYTTSLEVAWSIGETVITETAVSSVFVTTSTILSIIIETTIITIPEGSQQTILKIMDFLSLFSSCSSLNARVWYKTQLLSYMKGLVQANS